MVERFNRTLLDMLTTTVNDHPADWKVYIRKLCFAYNTSIHSSTGYSPFFLMMGRQATIPIDLKFPVNKGQEKEVPAYVHQLWEGLQSAYALVREQCEMEHQRQKAIYDKKAHGRPYEKGDLVWLFSPVVPRGHSRKLHHPWKGPFVVVDKIGITTYKIKPSRNSGKCQIVHFDRLKPCAPNTLEAELPPPTSNRRKLTAGNSLPDVPPASHSDQSAYTYQRADDTLLTDDEDDELPDAMDENQEEIQVPRPQTPVPAELTVDERLYPARQRQHPDHYGPYLEQGGAV